jgi:hypothetical protein
VLLGESDSLNQAQQAQIRNFIYLYKDYLTIMPNALSYDEMQKQDTQRYLSANSLLVQDSLEYQLQKIDVNSAESIDNFLLLKNRLFTVPITNDLAQYGSYQAFMKMNTREDVLKYIADTAVKEEVIDDEFSMPAQLDGEEKKIEAERKNNEVNELLKSLNDSVEKLPDVIQVLSNMRSGSGFFSRPIITPGLDKQCKEVGHINKIDTLHFLVNSLIQSIDKMPPVVNMNNFTNLRDQLEKTQNLCEKIKTLGVEDFQPFELIKRQRL